MSRSALLPAVSPAASAARVLAGTPREAWISGLGEARPRDIRARRVEQQLARAQMPEGDIALFLDDVTALCQEFNRIARANGLGVTVDPTTLIARVRAGHHAPVQAYFDDSGFGGRVYDNQIETLAHAHLSLLRDPLAPHVILGAMQSGKTMTAILLLWHAAIFYLMTGIPLSPLYLLPDFIAQEAQTGAELERFMLFYGLLEFRFDRAAFTALPACAGDEWSAMGWPPALSTSSPILDPAFVVSPNLQTYLHAVLHVESLRGLIVRRSKSFAALDRQLERMDRHDLVPMAILDEVQYGAAGTPARICTTGQTLARINALTVDGRAPRYICTSATPFSETEPQAVRVIRQVLPEDYLGLTAFKGVRFPGHERARALPVLSLSEAGAHYAIPELPQINLRYYAQARAGRLDMSAFRAWSRKCGYLIPAQRVTSTEADYVAHVEAGLGATLERLVAENGGRAANGKPRGVCVRLRNNNADTQAMIGRLGLDEDAIEIVRFFGDTEGQSLRELLAGRRHPERPFLIVVTARARMADSFPREVECFIEFGERTADYNALLQGFVGRAMGAGKRTTVILSDENARILREYATSHGRLTIRASKHGYNVGKAERAREAHSVRLVRGRHPQIDAVLDLVQGTVVDHGVRKVRDAKSYPGFMTNGLNRLYGRDVDRKIPLLRILREHGIGSIVAHDLDLVMPGYAGRARIAEAGDTIRHSDGRIYGYACDETDPDFITVGLRNSGEKGSRGERGGVFRKGRTPSLNDTLSRKSRAIDHLEPSLVLTSDGGEYYRLVSIDIPLVAPVRAANRGVLRVMPVEEHFMSHLLTPCEEFVRDYDRVPLLEKAAAAGQDAR